MKRKAKHMAHRAAVKAVKKATKAANKVIAAKKGAAVAREAEKENPAIAKEYKSLKHASSKLSKVAHAAVGAEKKPAKERRELKKAQDTEKHLYRTDHPPGPPSWTSPHMTAADAKADALTKHGFRGWASSKSQPMEPQPPKAPSVHKVVLQHKANKGHHHPRKTKRTVSHGSKASSAHLPQSLKHARLEEAAAIKESDSLLHKAAQVNVRAHSMGK